MIRWYTVPCDEQFCFQHLHATKGMMGIGVLRESGKSRLTTSWFDILPMIYQDPARELE